MVERIISETVEKHAKKKTEPIVKETTVDCAELQRVILRLPWLGTVSTGYRKDIIAAITRGFA